jgi:hypothetical protein
LIAQDLIAWTQRLALDGELAACEPKTLRYRPLHTAARPAFHARRATPRLQRSWPRADAPAAAFARLAAPPPPATPTPAGRPPDHHRALHIGPPPMTPAHARSETPPAFPRERLHDRRTVPTPHSQPQTTTPRPQLNNGEPHARSGLARHRGAPERRADRHAACGLANQGRPQEASICA